MILVYDMMESYKEVDGLESNSLRDTNQFANVCQLLTVAKEQEEC
jgi:hypothetical protein